MRMVFVSHHANLKNLVLWRIFLQLLKNVFGRSVLLAQQPAILVSNWSLIKLTECEYLEVITMSVRVTKKRKGVKTHLGVMEQMMHVIFCVNL